MVFAKILFWCSLVLVFYTYVGYGLLLLVLVQLKKAFKSAKDPLKEPFEPAVTLVVTAFNEEDFIERKIQNTFELDYPAEKLQLIFITDGSTDRTPDIIKRYSSIRLLHQGERKGKVAAMNRAITFVNTGVTVFSDANTILNRDCIKQMVRHYDQPEVGGVAGEKKIIGTQDALAAGAGEGLYWKYESFLKKMDSELFSVVGAAGELFSLRTELYEATSENIVIEDFVQSLKICLKGYIVRYEPGAFASETSSETMKEEQKRKIRICAGAFQAMGILASLFNVFKYPVLSFQFISHRMLRWTLCPIAIVILLISNMIIVMEGSRFFYTAFLMMQALFYILAIVGWIYASRNILVKLLYVPYYFLFMNISVFLGFYRYMNKKQSVMWEKSARRKWA